MSIHYVYALSSMLNAAASAEVAYRYLRWWPDAKESILAQLVLGIGVAQTALTFITLVRGFETLIHPEVGIREPESVIVTLALALLLAGTYLHMVPAWQMRGGYAGQHPVLAILWRMVLVAVGIAWLAYWWKL